MEPRRGQCCGFVQEQEVKGRSVQVLTISSSRLPFDRFDRCIYGFGRLVVLIFAYDRFFWPIVIFLKGAGGSGIVIAGHDDGETRCGSLLIAN